MGALSTASTGRLPLPRAPSPSATTTVLAHAGDHHRPLTNHAPVLTRARTSLVHQSTGGACRPGFPSSGQRTVRSRRERSRAGSAGRRGPVPRRALTLPSLLRVLALVPRVGSVRSMVARSVESQSTKGGPRAPRRTSGPWGLVRDRLGHRKKLGRCPFGAGQAGSGYGLPVSLGRPRAPAQPPGLAFESDLRNDRMVRSVPSV